VRQQLKKLKYMKQNFSDEININFRHCVDSFLCQGILEEKVRIFCVFAIFVEFFLPWSMRFNETRTLTCMYRIQ
jgi:hypothetical protein